MNDSPTQDGRVGVLATPLGKDVLLLGGFDGREGLGELFEYRVEALSTRATIDFNQLLGVNLSVHLNTADNVGRDFSGVLVEARSAGMRGSLYVYKLVLKPWLWLLNCTSDCRIFSSMKVTDIIKEVFTDRKFQDFKDTTKDSYPVIEYCVQYRETDYNFVCRLMEEYGIYYFFSFDPSSNETPSKHWLVLADEKACHAPLKGLTSLKYLPASIGKVRTQQQLDTWSIYRSFQTGRYVLNDYDYEKPGANLLADAEHSGGYAHGTMEIYDFPCDYNDQGEGKTLAKVRLDADQAKDDRRSGVGYAPSLCPGYTIKRTSEAKNDSDDMEYLVLRCAHSYAYQTYESAGVSGYTTSDTASYTGSYEMASKDHRFRSPLLTRKPLISGTQSALVIGKQGEEIDVDSEGRVCVQFYWDRKKSSSRRVRVAQIWAGSHPRCAVHATHWRRSPRSI